MSLAIIRKKHKLTQEKLAEKAGISRPYLAKLENRKYYPTTKTIIALAVALNVTEQTIIDCFK